jgi:hypothetical protein
VSGLAYHYQTTGDHGICGLTLLQNGIHPSLRITDLTSRRPRKPRQPKPTFKVALVKQAPVYPLLNTELPQ